MPLFDLTAPVSDELETAVCLADSLASLESFQEFADIHDVEDPQATARALISVGLGPLPEDGNEFTPDELANRFVHVIIDRVNASHVVKTAGIVGVDSITGDDAPPPQQGQLLISFRRFARESEQRDDLYLFCWDRLSKIAVDLQALSNRGECGCVQSVQESDGPHYNGPDQKVAQGGSVWEHMLVNWGDIIGGEQ